MKCGEVEDQTVPCFDCKFDVGDVSKLVIQSSPEKLKHDDSNLIDVTSKTVAMTIPNLRRSVQSGVLACECAAIITNSRS